jgi:hypothetical protein
MTFHRQREGTHWLQVTATLRVSFAGSSSSVARRHLPHFRRRRTERFNPARGFPSALTGSGSARRSASFRGVVTSTTNEQGEAK